MRAEAIIKRAVQDLRFLLNAVRIPLLLGFLKSETQMYQEKNRNRNRLEICSSALDG